MHFEALAADFLRAIRGKRSQRAFSRRLGYRSIIAYRWEARVCFPTAAEVFRFLGRLGVDADRALETFFGAAGSWKDRPPLARPEGVVALLGELRGKTSILEIARRSGHSRFSVSRWLKGASEPRLPELLAVVDAMSFRVLDFLSAFTDVAKLPSAAEEWRALSAARTAAYDVPWSHAVLRVLEIADYRALAKHRRGWLSQRLGITLADEDRCLETLKRSRQIRLERGKWVVDRTRTIDTRADAAKSRSLRAHWIGVARSRLESATPGIFGYNLMALSRADLDKLRELHIAYFRDMQALVADSSPSECVALFNTQLVVLDEPGVRR